MTGNLLLNEKISPPLSLMYNDEHGRASEAVFTRLVHMAARLLNTPIALLTLAQNEHQWVEACYGLDLQALNRDDAFFTEAIYPDDLSVVPDAGDNADFTGHPLVAQPPYIRFFAAVPLKMDGGGITGSLCVFDTEPRSFSIEDQATLQDLSAMAAAELALQLTSRRLSEEIVERRKAEEAYTRLAFFPEIDPHPIIETNLTGEVVYLNPAAAKVFPDLWKEGVHNTLLEPLDSWLKELEKTAKISLMDEVEIGGIFWQRVITYLRPSGRVRIHAFDITDRRQAEAAIRYAIKEAENAREEAEKLKVEAEKANLAKSDFLARMSHELRTPMNAILGFGQLLEMGHLEPLQQDSVRHILKAGDHLLSLINEVLDISRIEAGRLSLSPEPVCVSEVVGEINDLVRHLAADYNVHLDSLSCDYYVKADRQRLKQVLLNLLSNAIKYNRAGGRVTISCLGDDLTSQADTANRDENAAPSMLRIQVCDNGLGMTPAQMERLFTPFERLGAEGSNIEGTGLGLSLSRRLVEVMGGSIQVESVVGQGSTFTVELPQVPDPLTELRNLEGTEDELVLGLTASTRTFKVLYIEDNLSNLNLIEQILRQRPDVQLEAAMQGRLGLEMASRLQPNLILLDLHLPDMMGDELLRRLKSEESTRDIPVVVLSADATPRQRDRLLGDGASDYLTKPLNIKHFLQVLQQYSPTSTRRVRSKALQPALDSATL